MKSFLSFSTRQSKIFISAPWSRSTSCLHTIAYCQCCLAAEISAKYQNKIIKIIDLDKLTLTGKTLMYLRLRMRARYSSSCPRSTLLQVAKKRLYTMSSFLHYQKFDIMCKMIIISYLTVFYNCKFQLSYRKQQIWHRSRFKSCRRTCLFRSDPNRKFLKEVRIKGEAHKE